MDSDIAAVGAPIAHDGGWGWIALCATFIIGIIHAGYLKSVGVLMVEWQLEYDVGAQEVSWIGTAVGFITCTGGVIASALSARFGSRIIIIFGSIVMAISLLLGSFTIELWQLYVTNLFSGLGISLGYLPALLSIGFYFEKKMGIANGIGFSGSGLGLVIVPPILQLLVDYLGWRTALRIFAGSALVPCLCGLLIKPTKKEKYWMIKEQRQRKRSLQEKELRQYDLIQENSKELRESDLIQENTTNNLKGIRDDGHVISKRIKKVCYSCLKFGGFHLLIENKIFIFIVIIFMWTSFASFGAIIFFNARAVFDVGLTQLEGSYLISAIGLGNLVGRLGHGVFLDRHWITPIGMFALTSVISAVAIICNPFSNSFWTLMTIALIFGLSNGPYPSLQIMVLRDMLPAGDVSGGFAVVLFFNGFAMVAGLFIMSYLFDSSGNYDLSFYVAGISLFISGLLLSLLLVYKKFKREPNLEVVTSNNTVERDGMTPEEITPIIGLKSYRSQQSILPDISDTYKPLETSV